MGDWWKLDLRRFEHPVLGGGSEYGDVGHLLEEMAVFDAESRAEIEPEQE